MHEVLDDNFDVERVPLYEGKQHSPEYLAKNPNHCVPTLEVTMADGQCMTVLESGAMVGLLADIFPEKSLAPRADNFSKERADFLQMLHFGTSCMDMMLWQIRVHTHLLTDAEKDLKTISRYEKKFRAEVEPQLIGRLEKTAFVCGNEFSAVDCVVGQNVLWAKAYGLCQGDVFGEYVSRLSSREAFGKAFADLGEYQLAPPGGKGIEGYSG